MSEIKYYVLIRKKDGSVEKRPMDYNTAKIVQKTLPLQKAAYNKYQKVGSIWTPK